VGEGRAKYRFELKLSRIEKKKAKEGEK